MANIQNQTPNTKGQPAGNLQGKEWKQGERPDMTSKTSSDYEKSVQGKGFDKNKHGSRVSDDETDADYEGSSVRGKNRE